MKVVFGFFILVLSVVNEVNSIHAHAEMYLANTNIFIGTVNFYEADGEDWGVVISGSVNRLRPSASLVCLLPHIWLSLESQISMKYIILGFSYPFSTDWR